MRGLALITLTFAVLAVPSVRAQAPGETGGLEARVWLDRGDEPVLRRGETVRIFYRASQNAYAAIFRIDTDGRISLIYPQDPTMDERLTGGVDYRLILPRSPVWRVDEDPGVGYFFMVASPTRLDLSAFPFDPEYGWDLGAVGEVVYEDPYVAIDDYVAYLIPNWEEAPYGLDFITYNVGDTYTYPRFLCYDCHDAQPYASWNPYAVPCTSYRVVIYDDPYFYPYYRYSGMAVVVPRPLVTQPRYAVAVRVAGDSYRPLVRTRPGPPRRTSAEFKERPTEAGASTAVPRRLSTEEELEPGRRPTLQRRPTTPSGRLPVRTPPRSGDGASSATPGRAPRDATIVRPNRPSTTSDSPTSPTPTRPSQRAIPTPRGGASDGGRPSTSVRPGTRQVPSSQPGARPSTPGQPGTRPSAPSRPTVRPSAPSQPGTRPSAPSRPSTRPSAPSRPSTRPSSPSRPTPRSSSPSRPSTRPTAASRSPQPSAPSRSRQPSASSRPSASGGSSPAPSTRSRPATSRPTANARTGSAPRR